MSARKRTLRIAPEAREDIRDLLAFTAKRWGPTQRMVYREALNTAFSTIRENPNIGRLRDDVGEGVRGFLVRQHSILYSVEPDAITVVRVVHVRKDLSDVFKR